MKLMTKGRGELHKRLPNKAYNKPKIAGGRWEEEEEGRGVVLHEAPDGPCVAASQQQSQGGRAEGSHP